MKLLSKQEAADQLGLCRATVHKLIKTEELPARRVGGQIRIDPDELRQWLATRPPPKACRRQAAGEVE